MPLGSFTLLVYVSSVLFKVCHAVSFACPVIAASFKKRVKGIPRDFDTYAQRNDGLGEFDFDCSDEELEVASLAHSASLKLDSSKHEEEDLRTKEPDGRRLPLQIGESSKKQLLSMPYTKS